MRSIACLITAFVFINSTISAQSLFSHGALKVSKNGHYMQFTDGTPFFWLGDTGWELFHRLTLPEIKRYLDNRAAKGFTVIQVVALAEFDGLKSPNRYGELPLKNLDPKQPNHKYFAVIDSTIHMARQRNLFIGLLPTWGDKVTKLWGEGPVVFDSANAYTYGRWLGNRYKAEPNIIWILGGDRPAIKDSSDWRPIWRAMAKGISEGTSGHCLITYHPWGGENSTSQWIHNESWLAVNMFQSGHGGGHDVACWDLAKRDFAYTPAKPTLDAEPNYEDHPVNPWPKWDVEKGYYRDYDVRKQCYRSVFAGACGVTYGHHAVWQFMSEREQAINYPDRGWVNAMDRPGAFQVGYLKNLIESRPMLKRTPDNSMLLEGQGEKGEHIEAFHDADSGYAMIYLPVGKQITINTAIFSNNLVAWWFNPRDGHSTSIGKFKKGEPLRLTPPSTGIENDWVLVIDDITKNYIIPH
jgi:Protein of unknown function (DUF4038)/Putative collagen-binding domain of a collagenase